MKKKKKKVTLRPSKEKTSFILLVLSEFSKLVIFSQGEGDEVVVVAVIVVVAVVVVLVLVTSGTHFAILPLHN